ncbi:hypothetical protein [Aeoliella sp.]|uniref:hypothetical protein n=1 Tax=Aeoliella sp. TaxID=2795800 RepID=UPI003CCB8CE7
MNDPARLPDGLVALFEKAVAGELSAAEQSRLESELRDNVEVRAAYRNYVAVHVELAGAVRMSRARQVVYEEVRSRAASSAVDREVPASKAISARGRNGSRRTWWAVGIAAMLGAIACVPLLHQEQEAPMQLGDSGEVTRVSVDQPPAPVATITSNTKTKWRGSNLAVGHTIHELDQLELQSGEAHISVGYGAEVVAMGPCSLTFESTDRIKLNRGHLAVHVAEWAEGFTVATETMEVVDLGATFSIRAATKDGDEARVLDGLVRVHPKVSGEQSQRGLLLTKGESITVDRQGHSTSSRIAPSHLPKFPGLTDITPYRPVNLCNTGIGLSVGDEDQNWRIVAGPEGFGSPQYATVVKPHYRYLPNDRNNSQWVSIANWKKAQVDATYTFRTTFDLTGFDLVTIKLFGRFLADNGVQEVRVNGVAVNVEAWVDSVHHTSFNRRKFRYVEVTDELVQGENVIEVDVFNAHYASEDRLGPNATHSPNNMALRVEWYAFGRQTDLVDSTRESQRTPSASRTGV